MKIASVRAFAYRSPIATPVIASFGAMRDRPMVLVCVEDQDGAVGWGEIWCNFPSVGAEYRARMVEKVLAPLVEGRDADPAQIFSMLLERTAVLAIQAGEPGPIAQSIAGVDIALWDLAARRAGVPLWRMLGGVDPSVPVYASGLNPDRPEQLALERQAEGHTAFKLKVGFGLERDMGNLRALRDTLGAKAMLMVDANQAWSPEEAARCAPRLDAFGLRWLEEPMRADMPWPVWQGLARSIGTPLAAGENVAGAEAFAAAIGSGALGVVQPDIGKWGGFSGCLPVAQRVAAAGLTYCPHWLGGGIGLVASAHLLAAVPGGVLEIDSNTNPLRSLTCGPVGSVSSGRIRLTELPGLGVEADQAALQEFLSPH